MGYEKYGDEIEMLLDEDDAKKEISDESPEERNALSAYIESIRKYTLLTADEERDLAVRAGKGDRDAREKLINSNLRLVISMAKKYSFSSMDIMDIIGYGNIGLVTAVDKFDPSAGTRFSTYATYWIRQSINRNITAGGAMIRIPENMADKVRKIRKSETKLSERLGRSPSVDEIAADTGFSTKKVLDVVSAEKISSTFSLDSPTTEDGKCSMSDITADNSDIEDGISRAMLPSEIGCALKKFLSPRERSVLTLHYGLDGDDPHTLEYIGNALSLSRERIRQIESGAIRKLRCQESVNALHGFIYA